MIILIEGYYGWVQMCQVLFMQISPKNQPVKAAVEMPILSVNFNCCPNGQVNHGPGNPVLQKPSTDTAIQQNYESIQGTHYCMFAWIKHLQGTITLTQVRLCIKYSILYLKAKNTISEP